MRLSTRSSVAPENENKLTGYGGITVHGVIREIGSFPFYCQHFSLMNMNKYSVTESWGGWRFTNPGRRSSAVCEGRSHVHWKCAAPSLE